MLRLIFKISIALLAFLIGVKAAMLWDVSPLTRQGQLETAKTSPAQVFPVKVSVRDLQSALDLYEGSLVSVAAAELASDDKLSMN
jgi:hypothetical protein